MMQSENAEPLSQECLTLLRDIDRGHTALPATDRARRKHGRALDALLRRGLVMSGRNGGLAISARGKRLLRLGQADEYGSARHGVVTSEDVHVAGLRQQVRRNRAESPLSWLRHRQKTGSRLVEEHELDAGERLREDFTLAALTPRITMN